VIPTLAADAATPTRLTGLALVCSSSGHFAALAFDGDAVGRHVEGRAAQAEAAQRLVDLADGTPVITDSPKRAFELLARAGARTPVVWDVLELASLVAPACPSGGLERATAFFGIVVDGTGPLSQARRAVMLFELLVTLLDQLDSQTLLHVTRLAAGLDWPLRALFGEVQRRRALSPLETGALAAGTPMGAWAAQGAPGRRRQVGGTPPPTEPAPVDPEDVARRLGPHADIARSLPGYEARGEQLRMAQLVT
jgi:hypothetical protein